MADTSVTYTGNNSTTNFSVPFPYILNTHVKVYINATLRYTPLDYVWLSASTIQFGTAPAQDAAIKIQRVTPGDARLVDFTSGAVLTEADLDLSANQNFFLSQEAKEGFADLMNAELLRIAGVLGIIETDPDAILAAMVTTALDAEAAAELQQRVNDIDANGEGLLNDAILLALLGDANVGYTAFVLDTTKVKIDSDGGDTFATRLSALALADSDNVALVTTEAGVRLSADNDLEAHYGVSLNVNNYITGFVQNNDGTSGDFTVLADKFSIVHPHVEWAASTAFTLGQTRHPTTPDGNVYECTTAGTSGGSEPTWDTTPGNTTDDNTVVWTAIARTALVPFQVEGGVVRIDDAIVRTVRYGQTAYDTGTGYWLGDDGGTPKFSIGNSAGNKMTWDGSALAITGGFNIQNASGSFNPSFPSNTWSPDSDPSGTIHYLDLGKVVFMWTTTGISKTSASTDFVVNNVPATIRPVGLARAFISDCQDNGIQTSCQATVTSAGLLSFAKITSGHAYNGTGWTASGTKGYGVWFMTYVK